MIHNRKNAYNTRVFKVFWQQAASLLDSQSIENPHASSQPDGSIVPLKLRRQQSCCQAVIEE